MKFIFKKLNNHKYILEFIFIKYVCPAFPADSVTLASAPVMCDALFHLSFELSTFFQLLSFITTAFLIISEGTENGHFNIKTGPSKNEVCALEPRLSPSSSWIKRHLFLQVRRQAVFGGRGHFAGRNDVLSVDSIFSSETCILSSTDKHQFFTIDNILPSFFWIEQPRQQRKKRFMI